MKPLFSVLIIILFVLGDTVTCFAQSKTLVIKTGKLFLKKKQMIISGYVQNYADHRIDFDDEKFLFGRVTIDYFPEDTLVLKLKGMAPIFIEGLKKINGEVLKISNIEFAKYTAIDTLKINTIYYYNKDSVDEGREKIEFSTPNNSLKSIKSSISLRLNNVEYHLSLVTEEPYRTTTWACTPGKISYCIYSIGVKKYYVLKL